MENCLCKPVLMQPKLSVQRFYINCFLFERIYIFFILILSVFFKTCIFVLNCEAVSEQKKKTAVADETLGNQFLPYYSEYTRLRTNFKKFQLKITILRPFYSYFFCLCSLIRLVLNLQIVILEKYSGIFYQGTKTNIMSG